LGLKEEYQGNLSLFHFFLASKLLYYLIQPFLFSFYYII
jgi:hypothetical protein